jgi:probable HAF family extracellular repeat protein
MNRRLVWTACAWACAAAAGVAGSSPPAAAGKRPTFRVVRLPSLGGDEAVATGINNRGDVCGSSARADGVFRACVWSDGTVHDLGGFGEDASSSARAINDQGDVVGQSIDTACLWRGGQASEAFPPSFGVSVATAITRRGMIAGLFYEANGPPRSWTRKSAVRYLETPAGAAAARVSGANGRGHVVGEAVAGSGLPQACRWVSGAPQLLGTLPGGSWSAAFAVNEKGSIAGESAAEDGESHAFLWRSGRFRDLGTLGGPWSSARGLNDRGQVVGLSMTRRGDVHAFLWQDGRMLDLNDRLRPGFRGVLAAAAGINNRSEIICSGGDSDAGPALLLKPD